jgi:signal transduction histidine kinase
MASAPSPPDQHTPGAEGGSDQGVRLSISEQAALRRVATQIAQGATPSEVFAHVAAEVGEALGVALISVVRYDEHGRAIQVGAFGRENPFPVGTAWVLDETSVSGQVWRTRQAARVDDYDEVPGPIAATLARSAKIRSAIGVPVVVGGRIWGVMMALSSERVPLPQDAEERLGSFTELVATAISSAQVRDDLQRLADEQAALRRVATLVAEGSPAASIFDAVCEETGRLIGASIVNLAHFTADDFNLTMSGWSEKQRHVPTGTRLPLREGTINSLVRRTGKPGRVDSYDGLPGELAQQLRELGIRSEVGAPVVVDGRVWGALIAGTDADDPLPPETEERVASFAELVGTAISNATTHAELMASRARIVAAADEARRKLERNLHDGVQQRLVVLGLDLQTLRTELPADAANLAAEIDKLQEAVDAVLEDVREISQGLHPAVLSHAGLAAALKSLERRSPVPIDLELSIQRKLPQSVEIATYYVVSEALANIAKHAQATTATVRVDVSEDQLSAMIKDDGVGGAHTSDGSGLVGLVDRVEALGGSLVLVSPPGQGTTLTITLPLP